MSTQKEWEEQPTYEEVADAEFEQGPDPEYDESRQTEYDEASQRDFGDDVSDPDAQEASQEWYARKQK